MAVEVPFPDNLPSQLLFYGPFEESKEEYVNSCGAIIGDTLSGHSNSGVNVNKIKSASCFVSGMYRYKKNLLYNERWNLLYYWIGDKLSKSSIDNRFKGILQTICNNIQGTYGTEGFEITCRPIDKNIFDPMKIIFDFSYNHNAIQEYLQKDESACQEKWSRYKQNVTDACTIIQAECPTNGYCSWFHKKYEDYCNKKLQSLECKSEDAETLISTSQTDPLNESVRSATTISSISSIFGTLATIGAPYLLYKYKPWSSWFGNHSSGNGKSRKRRTIGQNFGSSIEDTLTEYSTDNSAIGESTAADDSTTLRSSAATYTRPSTRGGKARTRTNANNNTQGRGMVGYQKM